MYQNPLNYTLNCVGVLDPFTPNTISCRGSIFGPTNRRIYFFNAFLKDTLFTKVLFPFCIIIANNA